MWSPSLAPKPKDWPEHVDVVGTFFEPLQVSSGENPSTGASNNLQQSASPELLSFLDSGSAPVFVGFGSMVIANPEHLIAMFLEAAASLKIRIVIQSGWTDISQEKFIAMAEEAQLNATCQKKKDIERNLFNEVIVIDEDSDGDSEFPEYVTISSSPQLTTMSNDSTAAVATRIIKKAIKKTEDERFSPTKQSSIASSSSSFSSSTSSTSGSGGRRTSNSFVDSVSHGIVAVAQFLQRPSNGSTSINTNNNCKSENQPHKVSILIIGYCR